MSMYEPWTTHTYPLDEAEYEWGGIRDIHDYEGDAHDSDEGEGDVDESGEESSEDNHSETHVHEREGENNEDDKRGADADEWHGLRSTDLQNVDECVDLSDDIQTAFRGDFDFEGRFVYRCELYPHLPCLLIPGIGPVGQPLHDRDAKLIASVATKVEPDMWAVDATQVTFENPKWELYVQNTVLEKICEALGVADDILPRCKLQRLLLHGPGYFPFFRRDEATEPGLFARFDIILPSHHAGGHVHVSHGSKSQIFDFSDSSMLSTSALAWFREVTLDIGPVTSGYRLTLSYDIVQGNSKIPRPVVPDVPPAMARLSRVLGNWSAGLYRGDADIRVLCYTLGSFSHAQGVKSLWRQDAQLIGHLRGVADELGFKLRLAKLEYRISGPASGPPKRDCGYCDRDEYDSDCDGFSIPEMDDRLRDNTMELCNLVDLEGVPVLPPTKKVDLDPSCLVPADAFEDDEPDWTSFDGYRWDDGSKVHHHYQSIVLVLYHEGDEPWVNPPSQSSGIKRKREVEI